MKKYRGLLALITLLSVTITLQAKFIVVDEVVKLPSFVEQIEPMGSELSDKSGINVYMSLSKALEENQSIISYQKELISGLEEPAILLSFIEEDKQVQIYAEDKSLYKLFDKEQIMDPLAIWPFFNGAIIPILGAKSTGVPDNEKYAVAMFNGYAEICEQVADAKGIELSTAVGNTNKNIYKFLISLVFIVSFITVAKLANDYRKRRKDG